MRHVQIQKQLPLATLLACVIALALILGARPAHAAPTSHILRNDPRAGLTGGKPILTTLLEVDQFKALSDILLPCAQIKGSSDTLTCWSQKIETPGNIFTPISGDLLDASHARLVVKVGGNDALTTFQDKVQWGKAKDQPNVGTAWLIALDASHDMGARYAEAREVANQFIATMQKNDLIDLMIFNDRQVIATSKWKTFAQRNDVVAVLSAQKDVADSNGGDRALFDQIKKMTQDAFGALGNWDTPAAVPLHQAMVVLSNGEGHNDAASMSPTAAIFAQYLDNGRFPENNTSLPRTPLPVISIWFPNHDMGFVSNLYKNNEAQFMQSLANPEIGGFFDVVQEHQGADKGKAIIGLVRARFDNMWIVHWRLACLNPTVTQSFNLFFEGVNPPVAPDGTMTDVPIGVNPTEWPLDIDFDKTQKEAQVNPLYPGGTFKVYGDFCWGGDKGRAEAYFIPTGTKAPPNQNTRDPDQVKKAMQSLIAQNMRGPALDVGDTFAVMQIPDDEKLLDGSGDNMVARVVLYDNSAKRASAVDEKTVLSLKATAKPLSAKTILGVSALIVLAIVGILVVIVILMVVLMRGGGGGRNKRGGGGPPPPAQPPPPQYGGAPPYGAAPPPQYGGGGGGYNQAQPYDAGGASGAVHAQPMFAPAAAAPVLMAHAPQAARAPVDAAVALATPAVVQVRCPACQMMTMATPGQPSVCFSCGQPLPANIAGGGGGGNAPAFPLTGAMPAPPQPPPNPYAGGMATSRAEAYGSGGAGGAGAQTGATAASISGPLGQFTIRPGAEVRVGRDPAQCPIFLAEPRVSGVHATLKFEAAQLWVRDETSNNGTLVAGARVSPGVWTPVQPGTQLRFGPIEFVVQLENQ